MLLITCIYSHARWIRNATTIICYTPLLEDCSTIISFRRSPTLILHTRRNRIKLQSHRTETGTLMITGHQLYPRHHAQPMAGHIFDTLGKVLIKPRIWFGKEDIATTVWEEPRSKIVHALVACYGGRIGYKEACFSLDLFIISLSSFESVFVCLILFFTSV